ncbi:hypothetical protein D0Z67_29170 (plasmid) [Streptomyces seoulensis]|uniref:Uncharacterized protein n=2 Tax=Streptomyces seoulensis TaxID=73044 RepID=A0A4P6U543_STRSO|nr:hypothetical protein D0Z67_29170 [Streptomyces seoulensis]
MDTPELIRRAERALDGKHPKHDFPIPDAPQAAMPYLLMALVKEQRATNWHLTGIADSLSRIAKALEQQPEPAQAPQTEPQPKRRLWLPNRRNT